MKKRILLGIGLGLIFSGMSSMVQAQTIYNSIGRTDASKAEIGLYGQNRRQLEQKPRPEQENPGHKGSKTDDHPKPSHSVLDMPSG